MQSAQKFKLPRDAQARGTQKLYQKGRPVGDLFYSSVKVIDLSETRTRFFTTVITMRAGTPPIKQQAISQIKIAISFFFIVIFLYLSFRGWGCSTPQVCGVEGKTLEVTADFLAIVYQNRFGGVLEIFVLSVGEIVAFCNVGEELVEPFVLFSDNFFAVGFTDIFGGHAQNLDLELIFGKDPKDYFLGGHRLAGGEEFIFFF